MLPKCLLFNVLFFIQIFSLKAQTTTPPPPVSPTKALEKKIQSLTYQNTQLKSQQQQATAEIQRLQNQITGLQKLVSLRNDSIARQQKAIDTLHGQIAQLKTKNQQVQNQLNQRTSDLQAANTRIKELEYDRKILIDNHIVRIYNFSADDVRKQFIRSLSAPESGFQYDDDLIDDEIQITRNFNGQAESWWVFDKTLDTILELKIRIKPHLYDPQKAVVFGDAKLLQKTRYSNKSFDEQHDREKIALYRNKLLDMLEGKLSGTSEK
ncbi:hypothetical protein GCM10028807_32400 [Spirosoma daeguense]